MGKIGVSVNLPMLLGKAEGNVYERLYAAFGTGDRMLGWLRDQGAEVIELRAVSAKTEACILEQALTMIRRAGLNATVHGALTDDNEAYIHRHESALRSLLEHQGSYPFTVHPRATQVATIDALLEMKQLTTAWEGFDIALENQRMRKPGDSHVAYLPVVETAAQCGVSVTWDMGHYLYNLERGTEHPLLDETLTFVRHTHIHSLDKDGNTHQGLEREPICQYIAALERVGYTGIYNLELFSKFFPVDRSPKKAWEDAICLLRSMLK